MCYQLVCIFVFADVNTVGCLQPVGRLKAHVAIGLLRTLLAFLPEGSAMHIHVATRTPAQSGL